MASVHVSSARVAIVGLHGGQWFGDGAAMAMRGADVLIGHRRQLDLLPPLDGEPVELWGDIDAVIDHAAARADDGARVAVLAAGDPGFFGLVRRAAARLGEERLDVHPAPSSVSLAFARVGCSWDDAVVASAHGRPVEHAIATVMSHPKVAVLVSPDQPPQALGAGLVARGCGPREVVVCARLGEPGESIIRTDLSGLAGGTFDPMAVVVLRAPDAAPAGGPGVTWGADESAFDHRAGMITKAEVRAVALSKLAVPPTGVLWDIGAGSGSVGIEAARLAPGLAVYAVERRADDINRIASNARGTGVRTVHGEAPAVLADLPDPDRAFVGGGGIDVLDAVLARLRTGGRAVATFAAMDRALAAAERLGNIVQVSVSRGVAIGDDGALRLEAENPVFVAWGPKP